MAGTPDFLQQDLGRYTEVTPEGVVEWGKKVLEQPRIEIHYWPEADKPETAEESD